MSVPNRKHYPPESATRDVTPAKRNEGMAAIETGMPSVPPEPLHVVRAIDALAMCMLDGCVGG